MKNISRRVFIKGMAVAAAATAASTVLAGCNFSGNEPEVPVTGFVSETKTLTLGEEKVTVTTTGCGYKANGDLQVDIKVVNECDNQTLTIVDSITSARDDGRMYVESYVDGQYSKQKAVTVSEKSVASNDTGKDYVLNTDVTVAKDALGDSWKSVDLVFTLALSNGKDVKTTEVTFTINK